MMRNYSDKMVKNARDKSIRDSSPFLEKFSRASNKNIKKDKDVQKRNG